MSNTLNLLTCPDCRSTLNPVYQQNQLLAYYCDPCELIFPIKEGILIILAKNIRRYTLEYSLLKSLQTKLRPTNSLTKHLQNTLALVENKKGCTSWEWDDEQFWTQKYTKNPDSELVNCGQDRLWQREPLVKKLISCTKLDGKIIVDVGCGEGLFFRRLLLKHSGNKTLYVATDISFMALKNNRRLNPHHNTLYIVCSDDYPLPLKEQSVDVLCYFGILHHTKNKTLNIQKDSILLKPGSHILLSEGIERPTLTLAKTKIEASAHEEHISKQGLLTQLRKQNTRLLFYREEATPIYTAMLKLLPNALLNSKHLFQVTLMVDVLVAKTIGKVNEFFEGGEILLVGQVNDQQI